MFDHVPAVPGEAGDGRAFGHEAAEGVADGPPPLPGDAEVRPELAFTDPGHVDGPVPIGRPMDNARAYVL
ncbi:hypothetical protein AB0J52_39090, partial [Spirillospora sp. NPDC049652]